MTAPEQRVRELSRRLQQRLQQANRERAERGPVRSPQGVYRALAREALAFAAEQRPTYADALALARGCHDYNGGHHGDTGEAFHHGIQTVINVLERAAEGINDHQSRVVRGIGSAKQQPAPLPALSDEGLALELARAGDEANHCAPREILTGPRQNFWRAIVRRARELVPQPARCTERWLLQELERELEDEARVAHNAATTRKSKYMAGRSSGLWIAVRRLRAARLGYRLQEEGGDATGRSLPQDDEAGHAVAPPPPVASGGGEHEGSLTEDPESGDIELHTSPAPPPEPAERSETERFLRGLRHTAEDMERELAPQPETEVAELRGRLAAVIETASTPGAGLSLERRMEIAWQDAEGDLKEARRESDELRGRCEWAAGLLEPHYVLVGRRASGGGFTLSTVAAVLRGERPIPGKAGV